MNKLFIYASFIVLMACNSSQEKSSVLLSNIEKHLQDHALNYEHFEVIIVDSIDYKEMIEIETAWMDLEEEDMVTEEVFESTEPKVLIFQELKALKDSLMKVPSEDYELVVEVKAEKGQHFLLVKGNEVIAHFDRIEDINQQNIHDFEGKATLLEKIEAYKEAQSQEEEIEMEAAVDKALKS